MRIIDISQSLSELTPVYPGDPEVTLSKVKDVKVDGYTAYLYNSGLHAGTHVDFPSHFGADMRSGGGTSTKKSVETNEAHFNADMRNGGGTSTKKSGKTQEAYFNADMRGGGDFPPDLFFGKGVLIDVRGEKIIKLSPFIRAAVKEGCIVLLYTGASAMYGTPEYYSLHPLVSAEFAEFLVAKKIKMLGIDAPSPDYSPFECHKILLAADIFILEDLTGLEQLSGIRDFSVAAFPLKIAAEASPVRAVCFVD